MVASEEGKPLRFRQWHQELRNLLIQQGLTGYRQRALLTYFDKTANPDDVKAYLELLLKEDKVQKFKYKSEYWWRATTEILKEEV